MDNKNEDAADTTTPPPLSRGSVLQSAREEARAGQCLVCLGDGPAVAMLCCGAPAHVACMARWVRRSDVGSCPHCRASVPREADGVNPHSSASSAEQRPPGQLLTVQEASRMIGDLEAQAQTVLQRLADFRDVVGQMETEDTSVSDGTNDE